MKSSATNTGMGGALPHDPKPIKTMCVIHPGKVRAKDGDIHFITAEQLIRLYGVHPKMCVIAREGWDRTYSPDFLEQFVHLYPREDGNYDLSSGAPEEVPTP